MSNLATYGFLPWCRKGIAAKIEETDALGGDSTVIERASLTAELQLEFRKLNDTTGQHNIQKTIELTGPGDVLGFSRQAIVRIEPYAGDTSFAANGLPFIEFYEEDFPWRYTPAKEHTPAGIQKQTKLRPWITLIVLSEDEFTLQTPVNALPYIAVSEEVVQNGFPRPQDVWAFAHVQINNPVTTVNIASEVGAEIDSDPDVALSRLLCSRKLQKNRAYTAFVIPSFETGRLAGLGISTTNVLAQEPAWKKAGPYSAQRPFHFPVYYQWSFRTGSSGDFETLAVGLKPIVLGKDVVDIADMPLDISNPGFNLSAGEGGTQTINLEVALKPLNHVPDSWPAVDPAGPEGVNSADLDTIGKLRDLLNLSADLLKADGVAQAGNNPYYNTSLGDDPMLVPPVYGVWHANIEQIGNPENYTWIEQLNLDFRYRAAAGLGATIVQKYQEEFMKQAWQQINEVNEANRRIEEARLASMVNQSLVKKHIVSAGNDIAVVITTPVQHLVKENNNSTVQQAFTESRIPNAVKSAAFRKLTRPGTTLSKALKSDTNLRIAAPAGSGLIDRKTLLQNFNLDETNSKVLRSAYLKSSPSGALEATDISDHASAAVTYYKDDIFNKAKEILVTSIRDTVNAFTNVTLAQLTAYIDNLPSYTSDEKKTATSILPKLDASSFPLKKNQTGDILVTMESERFSSLFNKGVNAKRFENVILKNMEPLNYDNIRPLTTGQQMVDLQQSINGFSVMVKETEGVKPNPVFSGIETVAGKILTQLEPASTMARKLSSTISINKDGEFVPLQSLKPVMAYPEFEEPMYKYLLELSQNYILPNVDKLPDNSITIIGTNQSFIEAFLAGMNHEMARELLWREYPTDQRGSYFRQFWSTQDSIIPLNNNPAIDKDLKRDITVMDLWQGALGDHTPRGQESTLVLVIRGELLRKYPNTMIYAQKAMYNPDNVTHARQLTSQINDTNTRFPLFKAQIGEDITLLGFSLTEKEAKGERITNQNTNPEEKNPGWFFILKERPGQVRFGLDDWQSDDGSTMPPAGVKPATWNDLSWEHLVSAKSALENYHINFSKAIDIQQPENQPKWDSNAADLAAILFQDPVLFARHAAEMLPH
jgi:hypothetical protein